MEAVLRFDEYLEENYLEELESFKEEKVNNASNKLLEEYKEVMATQLIRQFGLQGLVEYKEGGNVTTLHNAQNNVFSNEKIEKQFKQAYDRTNYEKTVFDKNGKVGALGLDALRKNLKQEINNGNKPAYSMVIKNPNNSPTEQSRIRVKLSKSAQEQAKNFNEKSIGTDGHLKDGYKKNKSLDVNKDPFDIDHVVSGYELHQNDELRLYMTEKERNKLALHEKNLIVTNRSTNQSKGKHNAVDWANSPSKIDPSKTNAEARGLSLDEIKEKDRNAREQIKKIIKKAKQRHYAKNTIGTGVKQGYAVGKQQAIGLLLYELQKELVSGLKKYFKAFRTYKGFKTKLVEFKNCLMTVKSNLMKKSVDIIKKVGKSFGTGAISGFLSNIITTIINSFITTSKRWVKVITEGFTGIVESVKILIGHSNDSVDSKEKFKAAAKVLSGAVIATLGGIMTEALITYLKTTPFAMFAGLIGAAVGGIITGLVTVTVVNLIDNFKEVMENVKNMFKSSGITQEEHIRIYNDIMKKIDTDYRKILAKMYNDYQKLYQITVDAFDRSLHHEKRFANTVTYAKTMDVAEDKIIKNTSDLDDFFFN